MPDCPNCSSEIPQGKRFCADCGTPLSSQGRPVTFAMLWPWDVEGLIPDEDEAAV